MKWKKSSLILPLGQDLSPKHHVWPSKIKAPAPTRMSRQAAFRSVIWSAMVSPVKPGTRLANSTILIMHLVASSLNLSHRPRSSLTRWSALEFWNIHAQINTHGGEKKCQASRQRHFVMAQTAANDLLGAPFSLCSMCHTYIQSSQTHWQGCFCDYAEPRLVAGPCDNERNSVSELL